MKRKKSYISIEQEVLNDTTKTTNPSVICFGGEDVIAVFNGKAISECVSVEYEQSFDPYTLSSGTITTIVFDKTPISNDDVYSSDVFMLLFGNEYGHQSVMEFKDFKLTKKRSSISVEHNIFHEFYDFTFTSCIMKRRKWTVEKQDGNITYVIHCDQTP